MDLILALTFGLGTPLAYVVAFLRTLRQYHRYHDSRSMRALIAGFALAVSAMAAGLTIYLAVLQDVPQDVRRLLAGVAWGAFFAAGIVFAIEQPRDDDGR
jgi:hypothetical protein